MSNVRILFTVVCGMLCEYIIDVKIRFKIMSAFFQFHTDYEKQESGIKWHVSGVQRITKTQVTSFQFHV